MNLILVGKGQKGAVTLKGIVDKGWNIKLCVTAPEEKTDTKWSTSVDQICSESNVPIHKTKNINSKNEGDSFWVTRSLRL